MTSRRDFLLGVAGVSAASALGVSAVRTAAAADVVPTDPNPTDPPPPSEPEPSTEAPAAVGDGVADDTAAIQGRLDSSAATGVVATLEGGTYRCTSSLLLRPGTRLHLEEGARLLKDWAASPGLANAFLRNADFGVKSDGVQITGPGSVGAVDHARTGVILAVYGDDVRLSGFTIDTYAGGQAVMFAGDRGRVQGITIVNSAPTFGTGGIRMIGGDDFVASGCHVESGDDCLQFVPIGEPSALLYDLSISNGSYVGCTGGSTASRFMVALLEWTSGEGGMTSSVTDCTFTDCHGSGANRGIVVKNSHSSGTIENVRFTDCSVDMAASLDRTAQEIRIQTGPGATGTVRGISFTRTSIVNPVNSPLRIDGSGISDLRFEGCTFTAPSGASTTLAVVDGTDTVSFLGCTFDGAGGRRHLTVGPTQAVTNLRVDRCGFTATGAGVPAVNLVRARRASIQRSTFTQDPGVTTARAIRIAPESSRVTLRGNDFSGLLTDLPVIG